MYFLNWNSLSNSDIFLSSGVLSSLDVFSSSDVLSSLDILSSLDVLSSSDVLYCAWATCNNVSSSIDPSPNGYLW